MDTKKSDEAENDSFETIAPEKDNPVGWNSKSDSLATRSFSKMKLPEMSCIKVHRAILNLPSENFNVPEFDLLSRYTI
jgi:hypothetical protein